MSQQEQSQTKSPGAPRPATLTYIQKYAALYDNSQQMARARIIANHWLRAINELTPIEKGILRIIAEYCKGIEFRWDNYGPLSVTVDKEGLSLSVRQEILPAYQMISSNTGFSRGIHIFKIKLTTFIGHSYSPRDIGVATTKDVYGCFWRRNMKNS